MAGVSCPQSESEAQIRTARAQRPPVRPKRWIDPSEDTEVQEGDLRIVRTKCGSVRAAVWQQQFIGKPFYYCDRNGDGYDVVEVGVTWERKRSGPSGPSGKNLVPKRAVRIPTELWERFGVVATERKTDRNTVINELVERYVSA